MHKKPEDIKREKQEERKRKRARDQPGTVYVPTNSGTALASNRVEPAPSSNSNLNESLAILDADDLVSTNPATSGVSDSGRLSLGPGPPLDWSLKTSATFESPFDLAWARTARAPFFGELTASTSSCNYSTEWSRSLVSFQLAPANQVTAEWREAFRSLYYSLRHGQCPYFYLKARNFTVLWRRHDTDAHSSEPTEKWRCPCTAHISKSTRELRRTLKDNWVEYSLPADTSNVIGEMDEQVGAAEGISLTRDADEGATILIFIGLVAAPVERFRA